MTKKIMLASGVLVGLFMAVLGSGSLAARGVAIPDHSFRAEPVVAASSQPNDDEILRAVLTNVRNGMTVAKLKDFKTLGFSFGFRVKNGVVTIVGRLPKQADRNKVVKLVRDTQGVKGVNRVNFKGTIGNCPDGTIDCLGNGSVCAGTQGECPVECCGVG
ncbi:MAG: BON domain-containing protein [Acidobacteria bacterium]|nr:BON domain-containing protein [Acidobacteriota bacterium]